MSHKISGEASQDNFVLRTQKGKIMIEIYMPQSMGEWLAWMAVFVTFLWGIFAMCMPRLALRLARLQPSEGHPDAISEARSTLGGSFAGFALICLMFHPQPLLYLAFGAAFAFVVIGRILSFIFDRSWSGTNVLLTVGEAVAALAALAYALGWIA